MKGGALPGAPLWMMIWLEIWKSFCTLMMLILTFLAPLPAPAPPAPSLPFFFFFGLFLAPTLEKLDELSPVPCSELEVELFLPPLLVVGVPSIPEPTELTLGLLFFICPGPPMLLPLARLPPALCFFSSRLVGWPCVCKTLAPAVAAFLPREEPPLSSPAFFSTYSFSPAAPSSVTPANLSASVRSVSRFGDEVGITTPESGWLPLAKMELGIIALLPLLPD